MKVASTEHMFFPFVNPFLHRFGMTGRTGPIPTPMINPEVFATVLAVIAMATQCRRMAGHDVLKRFALGREKTLPLIVDIVRSKSANYITEFDGGFRAIHDPASHEIGEQGVHSVLNLLAKRLRQMGVDLGRTNTRMTEKNLHNSQTLAAFKQSCGK